MTPPTPDTLPSTLAAILGGTFNLLAFIVSMQDIESWLRVSSLVAGNLVGFLTIWNLALSIRRKKAVDKKEPNVKL